MSVKRCWCCVCIPLIIEQWRYDICLVLELDGLLRRRLVVARRRRLENQAVHSGEDEDAPDHARHLASQPVESAIGESHGGVASWRIAMTSVVEDWELRRVRPENSHPRIVDEVTKPTIF